MCRRESFKIKLLISNSNFVSLPWKLYNPYYRNIYKTSYSILDVFSTGMTLQYRSKRRGFHFYVQGQTKRVAERLYKLKIDMKLLKQEVLFDTVICTYHLDFDNKAYKEHTESLAARKEASLAIRDYS